MTDGVSACCYGPLQIRGRTNCYYVCSTCGQPCAAGTPTTLCKHPCTAPGCGLPTGACHERDAGEAWAYDPVACERQRAALDEHSRLSWELEQAERARD